MKNCLVLYHLEIFIFNTNFQCEICFDDIVNEEDSFPMMCEHSFCQTCWTE